MTEQSTFFAIVSRMKYIERWALMRSARPENLSEHSLEVAAIAHGLATLGNVRHGRHLDAEKAALIGLFHDTTEIVTGDMPTPVKYANRGIRDAYKDVERSAEDTLLDTLPEDLRPTYKAIFRGDPAEEGIRAKVDEMAALMPEVADFVAEFLPSYGKTLDQLL